MLGQTETDTEREGEGGREGKGESLCDGLGCGMFGRGYHIVYLAFRFFSELLQAISLFSG